MFLTQYGTSVSTAQKTQWPRINLLKENELPQTQAKPANNELTYFNVFDIYATLGSL